MVAIALLVTVVGARPSLSVPAGATTSIDQAAPPAKARHVIFIAGERSHGYGSHDHWAGSLLLSKWLNENHPEIETTVYRNGWPTDPGAFDEASAIVIYADGGPGHPVVDHLDQMEAMMRQGVGMVLLHYAVEVPAEVAGAQFLSWVGGYFRTDWSVNPHWLLSVDSLPEHPATRGVVPFRVHDEWYYHMQFRDDLTGVIPILTALPPASTLSRRDGPHSGNPAVRAAVLERREPQHVAWAFERANGGRGFGFTGGHWHWNWGHPMQRRLVLNAIAWAAGAEVPASGVLTPAVTIADLEANAEEEPNPVWLGTAEPDQGNSAGAETPTRAATISRLERWHREFASNR